MLNPCGGEIHCVGGRQGAHKSATWRRQARRQAGRQACKQAGRQAALMGRKSKA